MEHELTSNRNRIYKAMSRKEVAAKYGESTKTISAWFRRADFKLSPGRITPKNVERIAEQFGDWTDD